MTGVRFFFGICGGFHSTPLSGCGNTWQYVSGPTGSWTGNLSAFFLDLYNARITNVTPTMAHGDWVGVYGGAPGQYLAWQNYPSAAPPAGVANVCPNTPTVLQYLPGVPYGVRPCSTVSPFSCPSNVSDCASYCPTLNGGVSNPGVPVDDGDHGYNCSPANPIFVGWQNLYSVAQAVIGAAYNTPTAGAKGLNLFEFDVEQELDMTDFPVQARFIVDNSQTSSGNPDEVDSIRYYMGQDGYDIGRVTWSAAGSNSNVAGFNCTSVYGDYARTMGLDSILSAIEGGYIGSPANPSPTSEGLWCGGTLGQMFQMPVSHTAPNVADLHAYPCVADAGTPYCYSTEPAANVQGEAQTDFNDVQFFIQYVDPGVTFVLGETHSNSNDGYSETCEIHAPLTAASSNVAGFNASSFAGYTTAVFRPWINLPDAGACFTPSNQNGNQNNLGPYTPSQE